MLCTGRFRRKRSSFWTHTHCAAMQLWLCIWISDLGVCYAEGNPAAEGRAVGWLGSLTVGRFVIAAATRSRRRLLGVPLSFEPPIRTGRTSTRRRPVANRHSRCPRLVQREVVGVPNRQVAGQLLTLAGLSLQALGPLEEPTPRPRAKPATALTSPRVDRDHLAPGP